MHQEEKEQLLLSHQQEKQLHIQECERQQELERLECQRMLEEKQERLEELANQQMTQLNIQYVVPHRQVTGRNESLGVKVTSVSSDLSGIRAIPGEHGGNAYAG